MSVAKQYGHSHFMRRSDRLFDIISVLRDGKLHMAKDLAARLNVSVRTVYRDMETLQVSGVPVEGTRGHGYRATGDTTLPHLTLTTAELEALNLGIAIVAEAADAELAQAALSLGDKIDAVLPTQVISQADNWKFATSPFADVARGLSHMPTLRSAIKARQKLVLLYREANGDITCSTIRPLCMEYWGRVWTLTAWSETQYSFKDFRVDLIEEATALAELFTDEPGKTLTDHKE